MDALHLSGPPVGMLPGNVDDVVLLPISNRPRLLLIIDAEEEFDWKAPFSRENIGVTSMAAQQLAQRIFDRYGICPTYAVDYAVANREEGYGPLLELMESGACEIGAQLHAWVTPPFDEPISEQNSFASNLSAELEKRKLEYLTAVIEQRFGRKPTLYRAGRYGAGNNTPGLLEKLGYEIDCSVLPGKSSVRFAPDYSGAPVRPYWIGPRKSILEIPVTLGDVGLARRLGPDVQEAFTSPLWRKMKGRAIAARLGLFDRIRLTPEGSTLEEAKRLTRVLLAQGLRVFVVSYHTPSLVPGHTPYVQSQKDLQRFLDWLDNYCDFFMSEILGVPSTPALVRKWALESGAPPDEDRQLCL